MYPSDAADRFMLRLPEGMRERIRSEAAKNRRSMNSEVVFHLERAFRGAGAATGDEIAVQAPAAAGSHSDAVHGAGQFHP
jgi:hypothetical protein